MPSKLVQCSKVLIKFSFIHLQYTNILITHTHVYECAGIHLHILKPVNYWVKVSTNNWLLHMVSNMFIHSCSLSKYLWRSFIQDKVGLGLNHCGIIHFCNLVSL